MAEPASVKAKMASRSFLLNASEAAGAIGRDRYRTREDVLRAVVKRYDPSLIKGPVEAVAMKRAAARLEAVKKPEDLAKVVAAMGDSALSVKITALKEDPAAGEALRKTVKEATEKVVRLAAAKVRAAPEGKAAETSDALAALPGMAAVPAVAEAARAAAYTQRGSAKEGRIWDLYKAYLGAERALGASKAGRPFKAALTEGLHLGGRVDGLLGEDTVVEIKHRQRNFFLTIPRYEEVQIYVYMFVTGRRKAHWVQFFDGALRVKEIAWREEVWEAMAQAFRGFEKVLHAFVDRVSGAGERAATAPQE